MVDEEKRVYVIGMGEVGRRLAGALDASGLDVVAVTRDRGWDRAISDADGIRLVCVREEALERVLLKLRAVPSHRIVVIQNGWIRPLLVGLENITQGLIWFTSKGDFFRELRPSPFSGPRAEQLASALSSGGISATATNSRSFSELEVDKMGFNCVVGLPLAVHGLTLGAYLEELRDEARALFGESTAACAAELRIKVDQGWWDQFVASCDPIDWVRTGTAKALEFRNDAVARLADRHAISVPVTHRLLQAHDEL
jgi:ketopantoate reductase